MLQIACSLALALRLAARSPHAQATPVGLWKTIDDETKKEKSLVRIIETGGVLHRQDREAARSRRAKADAICEECSDERKDKPSSA